MDQKGYASLLVINWVEHDLCQFSRNVTYCNNWMGAYFKGVKQVLCTNYHQRQDGISSPFINIAGQTPHSQNHLAITTDSSHVIYAQMPSFC